MILIHANEATAAQRTVYFDLRDATDALTPELTEEGGQPQLSANGATWTNTGIGTLLPVGGAGQGAACAGRYYAVLTQAVVAAAGDIVETRYKSAATVETPGDTAQVVGFDPASALSTLTQVQVLSDATPFAGASVATIAADVVNIDGEAMRGTDSAALASVATEQRLARLDAAISTRSTRSTCSRGRVTVDLDRLSRTYRTSPPNILSRHQETS